jgi:hypothetical protein
MFKTFRDVINDWPGKTRGLAADLGVDLETVKGWAKRNSIPPEYWAAMLRAQALRLEADQGSIEEARRISADLLVALAAERFGHRNAA